MKGIILAGGSGTRLYPLSNVFCKQLMPIYDKPMIYYPLSTLMLMGIRDVLIISTPKDTPVIENLLGDGSQLGIKISYKIQESPNGIAEAFIIGEDFINGQACTLILGDNIFYGRGYTKIIRQRLINFKGALIFGYPVKDPERYGVVEFNENGQVISLEEKPLNPKSNYAVPGLYIYDSDVVKRAKKLKPSNRGELEITDLNKQYLSDKSMHVEILGRGIAWLDTGTHLSLLEAGKFIEMIESRQSLKIACIEEIAYRMSFISKKQYIEIINCIPNSSYKIYLEETLKNN